MDVVLIISRAQCTRSLLYKPLCGKNRVLPRSRRFGVDVYRLGEKEPGAPLRGRCRIRTAGSPQCPKLKEFPQGPKQPPPANGNVIEQYVIG